MESRNTSHSTRVQEYQSSRMPEYQGSRVPARPRREHPGAPSNSTGYFGGFSLWIIKELTCFYLLEEGRIFRPYPVVLKAYSWRCSGRLSGMPGIKPDTDMHKAFNSCAIYHAHSFFFSFNLIKHSCRKTTVLHCTEKGFDF